MEMCQAGVLVSNGAPFREDGFDCAMYLAQIEVVEILRDAASGSNVVEHTERKVREVAVE
jgi:hypothetical protein